MLPVRRPSERQRRLVQHLASGDVGTRVLVVEALLLGQIVSRGGDRQIAGLLVPFGGDFRLRRYCRNSATPL